jgi:hypothetical protein
MIGEGTSDTRWKYRFLKQITSALTVKSIESSFNFFGDGVPGFDSLNIYPNLKFIRDVVPNLHGCVPVGRTVADKKTRFFASLIVRPSALSCDC